MSRRVRIPRDCEDLVRQLQHSPMARTTDTIRVRRASPVLKELGDIYHNRHLGSIIVKKHDFDIFRMNGKHMLLDLLD